MNPYLQDTDFTLYQGDCLDVLRTLPDASVHCCVTSPPYWGLRDYGTGTWEGGEPDCDHVAPKAGGTARSTIGLGATQEAIDVQAERRSLYRQECGRCGATRVDRQIGLEQTPDEYVARMVEVFREVRRVLRDDGTLWLNLGSSYYSDPAKGGSGPNGKNESRWSYGRASRRDDASRDMAYTAPPGSTDPDSSCLDLCGECADDLTLRNQHSIPPRLECASPSEPTDPDTRRQDSSLQTAALDAQASTTPESSPQPLVVCWRCGTRPASVSLRVQPTSSSDAPGSADTEAYTNGTSSPVSGDRTQGRDAEGMAWFNYTRKLKPKDLVPIPWIVAMALQADGWYLRSEIIWAKLNPMPESVTDRPTKAHEHIFLLTKSPRYFFDQEAVREPHTSTRWGGPTITQPPDTKYAEATAKGFAGAAEALSRPGREWNAYPEAGRNIRSVWDIATQPYAEAHFATFPQELVRRCIAAGCPQDGVVLDPFAGSGTTNLVARNLGRRSIGIELNTEYCELVARRMQQLSLLT